MAPTFHISRAVARCGWATVVLLWVAGAIVVLVHGIKEASEAWTVHHWVATPCAVTKAGLYVPPGIRSGDEVRLLLDYEFAWNGQAVTIKDNSLYVPQGIGRDDRVEYLEEWSAFLRAYPRQICRVNPSNPAQTELATRSYRESLLFLFAGLIGLGAAVAFTLYLSRRAAGRPMMRWCRVLRDLSVILLALIGGGCAIWSGFQAAQNAVETRLVRVPCTMVVSTVHTRFAPDLLFSYEWDGHLLHSTRLNFQKKYRGFSANDDISKYPVGSIQECWVDRENPWIAALERNFEPPWRNWVAGGLFFALGLAGLILWLRRGFRFDRPSA